MTDPSMHIGSVLKRVRFERDFTLEETSARTGVSKAMLGQIERGVSVPTVSVLWKIATGLKVSFSELLGEEADTHAVVDFMRHEPVYEAEGRMALYDVFPYDPFAGFEYFYITLQPHTRHQSTPHQVTTEEYVVVTQGCLKLVIDGESHLLTAPQAMRFKGDREHQYINETDEEVIFQNVIRY